MYVYTLNTHTTNTIHCTEQTIIMDYFKQFRYSTYQKQILQLSIVFQLCYTTIHSFYCFPDTTLQYRHAFARLTLTEYTVTGFLPSVLACLRSQQIGAPLQSVRCPVLTWPRVKQLFQVVGQLLPPTIALASRAEGYEYACIRVQVNL